MIPHKVITIINSSLSVKEKARLLNEMGYRRTSWKYKIVSRIDSPFWRFKLAAYHAPFDFFGRGLSWAFGGRADHYRRCLSKDKIEGMLTREEFRLIKPSDEQDGYIPKNRLIRELKSLIKIVANKIMWKILREKNETD